jgi:hypothetical protein
MSFNKKFVPEIHTLKKELETNPKAIQYYQKADMLIGSTESIKYIKEYEN